MQKWKQKLIAQMGEGALVRIERSPEIDDVFEGYVVGANPKFVMLHVLEPNMMCLNGYCVMRMKDIRRWRVRDDNGGFLHRTLQLKGIEPVVPDGIDLTSWELVLTTANAHFPVINIHPELSDPEVCFIGRVEKVTGRKLKLAEITPAAKWEGTGTFKLKDLTRLEFGDGYGAALVLVSEE